MSTDWLKQYGGEIRVALTIRLAEQRLLELFSEGKLFGTIHTCIGQEFVPVAVSRCLKDQDTVFSNHRCHGHFLAYCGNIKGLIGEIMGKTLGVCGGRGGSQHLHQNHFFSNGILGGTTPVSNGLAFGHQLSNTDGIAVTYIGDGALGEGVLYESMNIASKWQLPVLFVCENNGYAQSTSQTQTLAGSITARAQAVGIETSQSDTWDWPALFSAMRESIDQVRASGRPRFHQVDTYRLMAHSKGDDNRPQEQVASYWEKDPIEKLARQYAADSRWQSMIEQIKTEIDQAVAEAESCDFGQIEFPKPAPAEEALTWHIARFDRERVVASVRRGLEETMAHNEKVVLVGEDIESPYGGAFKCTQGLSERFPNRVRNSPISEAAIVGLGTGLALSAMCPVVEIMFGDFLTLAADQWINHAAKFAWIYNDQVSVPLVIRTPMGGKRGYAATHSQSIEKHFLGLPGTLVLCLHHRMSPAKLYLDLLKSIDRPTLVIENKILYGQWAHCDPPDGFDLQHTAERFPTARLQPQSPPDLTMIALGGISLEAEQALLALFENEEIVVDLFLPSRLYPFDVAVFEQSLTDTRRLLVVEEGQGFVSMSSEILAQVAERFGHLNVAARRLTAAPVPIPAARPLEEACLVNSQMIVDQAMEVLRELVH